MRRALRIAGWIALAWFGCTTMLVLALRWIDPPTSAFILRERFVASRADKPYEVHHDWVDWAGISPHMKLAVIAAEDQRFATHAGFDLKSINEALEDRERGKRVRGASTISQQTVKNLFLWPGKSWVRKGLEAYFTVLVELLWPKRRILEVYLNIAEFGRGTFGIEAASRRLLRRSPAQLSAHEAALLAAVLPSPKRMRVTAPSRYVRGRQQWIVRQMRGLGGVAVVKQLE